MKKIVVNTTAIRFERHISKKGHIARFKPPKNVRQIELFFSPEGYLKEMMVYYEGVKESVHFSTDYKFDQLNDL